MPTTILNETKIALRLSTNDADLIAEISRLIDEAVLDLTKTSDIKPIDLNNLDAYEKGAIITYVKYRWLGDERYKNAYEDYKNNMRMSYAYRDITIPPINLL